VAIRIAVNKRFASISRSRFDGIPLDSLLKAAAVVGGAGLVAMGGAVLLPAAIIGGLNVVGFGAGGVIGGKS